MSGAVGRFVRRLLVVLVAGSVSIAWRWPAQPLDFGALYDSPGLPLAVSDAGVVSPHAGRIATVSDSQIVIAHANGFWSVFHGRFDDEAQAILEARSAIVIEGETLLSGSEIGDVPVYLGFWDQVRERWIDPRLILPELAERKRTAELMVLQDDTITTPAMARPGKTEFLLDGEISRLAAPRRVAVLVNGGSIGEVDLSTISSGTYREYMGRRYLSVGEAVLRDGGNAVELVIFSYVGAQTTVEYAIDTR